MYLMNIYMYVFNDSYMNARAHTHTHLRMQLTFNCGFLSACSREGSIKLYIFLPL